MAYLSAAAAAGYTETAKKANSGRFSMNNDAQTRCNRRTSGSGGGRRLTFKKEFDLEMANSPVEHFQDTFAEVKCDNTWAARETSAS